MSELEDTIRELICKLLVERQEGSRRFKKFASSEDLELAVSLIRRRCEELGEMCNQIAGDVTPSAVDRLLEILSEKQSRRFQQTNFPQNQIALSSFIPFSSTTGLCPLPGRVDCLTSPCAIDPKHAMESDLIREELYYEEIDVGVEQSSAKSLPISNLKRVKVSSIS